MHFQCRQSGSPDTSVAQVRHRTTEKGQNGCPSLDLKWFTASNYLRLFASVMMRGIVNACGDPDFFLGAKHGAFERTGAEKVTGLSLNMYQQLLRFMHLVDNKDEPNSADPEFDKCWKIRPLIKLLQHAFHRWVTPGKDNAVDEAGIPSRHRWMRTFSIQANRINISLKF